MGRGSLGSAVLPPLALESDPQRRESEPRHKNKPHPKSKSGGNEGRKKTSLEKVKLMKESVFANLGKRGTVSGKERSTVKSVPGENKKIFIYNFFP